MITEQQSQMIDLLISGEQKTNIATKLGVSRQTIYAWLQLKEVKKEKQRRLNDIKKEAKNKIATKVDNCIDVIYEIALKSKDTRTKFQAAKYLCDQFIGSPTAEKTEKEDENNKITVCLEDDDNIDNMMNRIEEHRTGADID